MNVIETSGLGKRYGGTWAMRECTLAIPAGYMGALVGPNGAGKRSLLNLAAPSAGAVTVLGGRPTGSPAALDGIAFVAQRTPLYKNLSPYLQEHYAAPLRASSLNLPGFACIISRWHAEGGQYTFGNRPPNSLLLEQVTSGPSAPSRLSCSPSSAEPSAPVQEVRGGAALL
jgi:ABC-type sugar transport system ATPase subunit